MNGKRTKMGAIEKVYISMTIYTSMDMGENWTILLLEHTHTHARTHTTVQNRKTHTHKLKVKTKNDKVDKRFVCLHGPTSRNILRLSEGEIHPETLFVCFLKDATTQLLNHQNVYTFDFPCVHTLKKII